MSVEWSCKYGHQFEPRYDSEPAQTIETIEAHSHRYVEALMRGLQRHTYVRDVCVKCGKTIERGK